jgi:D-serine dehydratase
MTFLPRLNLAPLDGLILDRSTKGLPFDAPALRLGDVGDQDWNVLEGDLPMPVAIIRNDLVTANSAWMSAFTEANNLLIAPHGKTTMSPHLFDLQIADGAWAITVATIQQLEVCRRFDVARVVLANQPVGTMAIDACFRTLQGDNRIELYCLADSADGLALLAEGARRNPPPKDNPLRVLVEIGFVGGRTGVRSPDDALDIARAVVATPGLVLAGFECFEGLLRTPQEADALIDAVAAVAGIALTEGLFGAADNQIVISAGGSSFFDRVGERFDRAAFSRPVLRVLRSGCYLTHDSIGYASAFRRIMSETTLQLPPGGLTAALEVWAYVQSRPESGRAILTMGKRDVGIDTGMPMPLRWYRPGGAMLGPQDMPSGHVVLTLSDQHCHLDVPSDSPLHVGDMVGFGNGHPCTTFDKWSMLLLVDEKYNVLQALKTFF